MGGQVRALDPMPPLSATFATSHVCRRPRPTRGILLEPAPVTTYGISPATYRPAQPNHKQGTRHLGTTAVYLTWGTVTVRLRCLTVEPEKRILRCQGRIVRMGFSNSVRLGFRTSSRLGLTHATALGTGVGMHAKPAIPLLIVRRHTSGLSRFGCGCVWLACDH